MSKLTDYPVPKFIQNLLKPLWPKNNGNTVTFKRYPGFTGPVGEIDQNAPIDSAGYRMAPITEVTNEQGE